jgi:hypothetical protein
MSAVNALTFADIVSSPTWCDSIYDQAETHVPCNRVPVVSARWTMEDNGDGTRTLVERWSTNQQKYESVSAPSRKSATLPLPTG